MKVAFRDRSALLMLGAAGIALVFVTFLLFRRTEPPQTVQADEASKLVNCRSQSRELLKSDKVDVLLLHQVSELCYNQVRRELLLSDFTIRKLKFVSQESDGRIMLWMVVAITISGVLLAGLQLLAAYRLASSGRGELVQGGEVVLEREKISVKSSVTGLLILTVSLAFFIVYVGWVYPIREAPQAPETGDQTYSPQVSPSPAAVVEAAASKGLLLRLGGIGAPPTSAAEQAAK